MALVKLNASLSVGIAIGGDCVPRILRSMFRINILGALCIADKDDGELGGRDEDSLVKALKQGKVNKPWVSGTYLCTALHV